jgi:hypothetical protein
MDLIASFTFTDLVAGVSLSMLIGVIGTALVANFQQVWALWASNPIVQTLVNTTLVVLENTEVVWKPALNASLVVIKPIAAFALMVLKPFGPLALVLADNLVKGLVVLGFVTAHVVILVASTIRSFLQFVQSTGLNVSSAFQSFAEGTKDFVLSLATVVKALGKVTVSLVHITGFIVGSFERVGSFLYQFLFAPTSVTWNDFVNLSIPFAVVLSVVSLLVWRSTSKNTVPQKKIDEECVMPRRSSRIARKRAMMLCSDSSFASEKPSLRPANL